MSITLLPVRLMVEPARAQAPSAAPAPPTCNPANSATPPLTAVTPSPALRPAVLLAKFNCTPCNGAAMVEPSTITPTELVPLKVMLIGAVLLICPPLYKYTPMPPWPFITTGKSPLTSMLAPGPLAANATALVKLPVKSRLPLPSTIVPVPSAAKPLPEPAPSVGSLKMLSLTSIRPADAPAARALPLLVTSAPNTWIRLLAESLSIAGPVVVTMLTP